MTGKLPRVEDLLLPKILHALGELEAARLPVHEVETRIALNPLMRAMFNRALAPQLMFGMMTRASVLFVVDHEEFAQAVGSSQAADGAPLTPELPPLPYPRIAVECAEDATWALGTPGGGEHAADLELFAINETEQGERWAVALLVRNAISDNEQLEVMRRAQLAANTRAATELLAEEYGQRVLLFELLRDGTVIVFGGVDLKGTPPPYEGMTPSQLDAWAAQATAAGVHPVERRHEPDDPFAVATRTWPIEFAHLVNARGVNVGEVIVPRGQRRRFQRKRLVHPRVYFVVIGGEDDDERQGHSEREYHCRWLVRGHWRRFKSGERTWVRPYIKGPAGAPWRGRPVYVTTAATEGVPS